MTRLTSGEINRIVYNYIGVDYGYLGDFSYRTHAEFYPTYCNLEIDPYQIDGTTRERFIEILNTQSPFNQATILRGVVNRFPLDAPEAPACRTSTELHFIEGLIARLGEYDLLGNWSPRNASETVELAISDAKQLLNSSGPASAVDRIHTALHAYLKEVCNQANISYDGSDTLARLLKHLRKHPALKSELSSSDKLEYVLSALGTILDRLNNVRNNRSLAHPNELLDEADAKLAINSALTILRYLDAKLMNTEIAEIEIPF